MKLKPTKIFVEYFLGWIVFLFVMSIYLKWIGYVVAKESWIAFIAGYAILWLIIYIATKDHKSKERKMKNKSILKKEADNIITDFINNIDIKKDVHVPDENRLRDFLKFKELYPNKDYTEFKKFIKEKKKL